MMTNEIKGKTTTTNNNKDPNLDPTKYFWDLRKEYLPFYRLFQYTEQFIKVVDDNGNGELDTRRNPLENTNIPRWVLLRW